MMGMMVGERIGKKLGWGQIGKRRVLALTGIGLVWVLIGTIQA